MLTIAAALMLAPMPQGAELEQAIAERDAALFWAAFENCDADTLSTYIAPGFRMVHDIAGLAASSKEDFISGMRENCASRAAGGPNEGYKSRRLFIPGSRRVQRLGDWGALEEGRHSFHELQRDGSWQMTGGARYIHVWQWTGDDFVLTESISVDHGPAVPYPPSED